MGREEVAHMYSGTSLSPENGGNGAICNSMEGPRGYDAEWKKSHAAQSYLHVDSNNGNNEPVHTETRLELQGGVGGGRCG